MTVWAERRPTHCPAGHGFKPGKVLVGFVACRCAFPALGHRTYLCLHLENGHECGLVILIPNHRSQL
jgi:hypothetical protein